MSQLSAAFRSYGVVSAATEDVRDIYAVYWNKAIAESLGAGDLYGEYERGEWDMAALFCADAQCSRGSRRG